MIKIYRNRRSKKLISFFLILIILLQQTFIIKNNQAEAAEDVTWAIDEYYNNEYLEVVKILQDEGVIILRGTHNKKTSTNYYSTDGFVLTADSYDTSGSFPSSARDNKFYAEKKPESDNGTTVKTLYYLKFEDIVGMAGKLGITGESVGNGTIPIYLHAVYDIYKGDTRVVNDVIGVREMINAPIKYNLGYTAWDPATAVKIPSYYNMRFDLSVASTYNIKVVAVDKDKNIISSTPFLTKKVIYKEKFSYTVPDSKKSIEKSSIKYSYSKKWFYNYTDRQKNSLIKSDIYNTSAVSINAVPDAKPGSTMTVYLVYANAALPTPPPVGPTPTPRPEIPETDVPFPDSAYLEFTDVVNTGRIRADVRGTERFVATLGVPTTESLFGEVTAKDYLLGYSFVKKVGIEYYPVKVTKNYILTWETATPESEGGGKPVTETVPVTILMF